MIRLALVTVVTLLVSVILLWLGWGEAKRLVLDTPKRLRRMRLHRRTVPVLPATLGGYHHGFPRGSPPVFTSTQLARNTIRG